MQWSRAKKRAMTTGYAAWETLFLWCCRSQRVEVQTRGRAPGLVVAGVLFQPSHRFQVEQQTDTPGPVPGSHSSWLMAPFLQRCSCHELIDF